MQRNQVFWNICNRWGQTEECMSQAMKQWKMKYLPKNEKLKKITTHRSRKKINFKESELPKKGVQDQGMLIFSYSPELQQPETPVQLTDQSQAAQCWGQGRWGVEGAPVHVTKGLQWARWMDGTVLEQIRDEWKLDHFYQKNTSKGGEKELKFRDIDEICSKMQRGEASKTRLKIANMIQNEQIDIRRMRNR